MGINSLKIILDQSHHVFKAGDTASGVLLIDVGDRVRISSVKMRIKGYTNVHWAEKRGTGPVAKHNSIGIGNTNHNPHATHFRAYEEYLNLNYIFVPEQSADLYLESGQHKYPFEVVIPNQSPTSFEHEHGRIRYLLQGTVEIPWAFDQQANKIITVISQVNLNTMAQLRDPISVSEKRKLGCLCFETNPIYATLSLKQTGFVPGESIRFNVKISNETNRTIGDISVSLHQVITLKTTRRNQTFSRDAGTQKFPQTISEKSKCEWNGSFVVPAVSPSSLNTCRIVEIQYFLVLSLVPSGPTKEFEMSIPICIGTIPIENDLKRANYQQVYQPSVFHSDLSAILDGKDDDMYIDTDYKPLYPYYDEMEQMKTQYNN
jgi:hypothetical protein